MSVQEIIRNRRRELKLTLKDVANALGVSEGTISRYESKEIQNMGIDKLEPLAEVLRCTPAYLMGWEDEPSGTAADPDPAPSAFVPDARMRKITSYYEQMNEAGKDNLLQRAEELIKLGYTENGNDDISKDSFSPFIEETIA